MSVTSIFKGVLYRGSCIIERHFPGDFTLDLGPQDRNFITVTTAAVKYSAILNKTF